LVTVVILGLGLARLSRLWQAVIEKVAFKGQAEANKIAESKRKCLRG